MTRRILISVVVLLCSYLSIASSDPVAEKMKSLNKVELVSKRTENSRTYIGPNGEITKAYDIPKYQRGLGHQKIYFYSVKKDESDYSFIEYTPGDNRAYTGQIGNSTRSCMALYRESNIWDNVESAELYVWEMEGEESKEQDNWQVAIREVADNFIPHEIDNAEEFYNGLNGEVLANATVFSDNRVSIIKSDELTEYIRQGIALDNNGGFSNYYENGVTPMALSMSNSNNNKPLNLKSKLLITGSNGGSGTAEGYYDLKIDNHLWNVGKEGGVKDFNISTEYIPRGNRSTRSTEYIVMPDCDWIHTDTVLDTTSTVDGKSTFSLTVDPVPPTNSSQEYRIGKIKVQAFFEHNLFSGPGGEILTEEIVVFQRLKENGIVDDGNTVLTTALLNNYPNPFNPETQISYSLAKAGNVKLAVYNTAGKKVAALVNGSKSAGNHNVKFSGAQLTSGIYYSVMQVDGKTVGKKKMMLIK